MSKIKHTCPVGCAVVGGAISMPCLACDAELIRGSLEVVYPPKDDVYKALERITAAFTRSIEPVVADMPPNRTRDAVVMKRNELQEKRIARTNNHNGLDCIFGEYLLEKGLVAGKMTELTVIELAGWHNNKRKEEDALRRILNTELDALGGLNDKRG